MKPASVPLYVPVCVNHRHLYKPIKSESITAVTHKGAWWRPRAAGSYLYASHHLSGLKLIKAWGLGDVSHEIIHPLPSPPLTRQGYSVSPQRPLIALFFNPQLSSALSFIRLSQCWRSLTHISIISFFFPLGWDRFLLQVFFFSRWWFGSNGGGLERSRGRLSREASV